ncbi:MAG TPA: GNAT family N-acetyltransferase [Trebonia sp.]
MFNAVDRGGVTIRPLSRDDFPLLHRWLAMPHVQAWWGSEPVAPADVERKYGPRADGTDPTRVFVIELAGQPVGIIQCYRHAEYADWDRAVGIPAAAGIDYLVVEPASRRALEKAGFRLVVERQLDSDDPSDAGSAPSTP